MIDEKSQDLPLADDYQHCILDGYSYHCNQHAERSMMWSDEARAAAAEARKKGAVGHNAGKGNRAVANHIKGQHKPENGGSVAGGVAKGAAIGAAVGGAAGALALRPYGGARIGAKLGAVAGAKVGAVAGGVYRYAKNRK